MEAENRSGQDATVALFPPEHYIPVPLAGISRVVCTGSLDPDQALRWQSLCRILKATFAHEIWRVSETAKADWAVIHATDDQWWCDSSNRDEALDEFLCLFLETLRKANFRPIPYHVIEQAERDDFLYMLPLQVDWSQLDGSFLEQFYERHPEWRQCLPGGRHFSKMLIFVRGLGEEAAEGRFLLQKIDLLVGDLLELCVFHPCRLLVRGLAQLRRLVSQPPYEPQMEQAEGHDSELVRQWSKYHSIHQHIRRKRVTLRQAGYGLRNLFRVTRIVEPTFKEVVLLYRLCPPAHRHSEDRGHECGPLQIRAYRDIPLSDLEVIFPAKKFSMKPLDLLKLTLTALAGVVIVAMRLLSAILNPAVMIATLASLAGYGSKVFFQFKVSRDRYLLLVTDALYSKHRDNDLGVLLYLLDSEVEQECKETLLAYAALLTGGPMRENDLDRWVEQLLFERFGVKVDFESDDALAKLTSLGLATSDETGVWKAVPLLDALRILNDRWDEYFHHPAETSDEIVER